MIITMITLIVIAIITTIIIMKLLITIITIISIINIYYFIWNFLDMQFVIKVNTEKSQRFNFFEVIFK